MSKPRDPILEAAVMWGCAPDYDATAREGEQPKALAWAGLQRQVDALRGEVARLRESLRLAEQAARYETDMAEQAIKEMEPLRKEVARLTEALDALVEGLREIENSSRLGVRGLRLIAAHLIEQYGKKEGT